MKPKNQKRQRWNRTKSRKVNLHYTPKIHKNNSLQHQKSKTAKTKICKGDEGVRKFTVKTETNPYKPIRSKKNVVCGTRCFKRYVSTTSHKWVAKTESQQREELHIRTLQTTTTCSSSASVPLEQSINSFSEGNIKQLQFNFWQGRDLTLHLSEKIQKLIEKHEVRENLISQFATWKVLSTTFAQKQFHQKFYKKVSPEKSEVKMNEMQKSQPSLHIKNPRKQLLAASKIKNDRN